MTVYKPGNTRPDTPVSRGDKPKQGHTFVYHQPAAFVPFTGGLLEVQESAKRWLRSEVRDEFLDEHVRGRLRIGMFVSLAFPE